MAISVVHASRSSLAALAVGSAYTTPPVGHGTAYWNSKMDLVALDATSRGHPPPSAWSLTAFDAVIAGLKRSGIHLPTHLVRPTLAVALAQGNQVFAPLLDRGLHASDVIKEVCFERVRQANFASAPSRTRCVFSVVDHDHVRWLGGLGLSKVKWPRLVELELQGTPLLVNAGWLDDNLATVAQFTENAKHYWAGDTAAPSKPELLFEGGFRVTRELQWP